MTLNRLLITAVVVENRTVRDVAAQYGVSQSWLFELLARYKTEGEAAFEPRSRGPASSSTAIPAETVEVILELREKLTATGLDAGPDTIRWHLEHHHSVAVSRATISRYLTKHGLVVPEPKKKPKSSYIRFQAEMPNETWQADFTHYRLRRPDGRPGTDTEILTWLDDCSRYALSVTAHHRVTGPGVLATFRQTVAEHRIPASTLDRHSIWVRGVEAVPSAGGEGSVPSGTCPSSLLDRVERSATPSLLTVLAGGANAGGSRCPVENPATPPPVRAAGIPVSECLVQIDLPRPAAAGRKVDRRGEETSLDPAHGHRRRGPRTAPGQPRRRAWRTPVVRPPLPHHRRRPGAAVGTPARN